MKILFLGTTDALTEEEGNFHSNMILESFGGSKLLIDAGSDIKHSLKAAGVSVKDLDAVYISHVHDDHMGGLEWLAFKTYFSKDPHRLTLYCHESILKDIWSRLEASLSKMPNHVAHITNYFNLVPIVKKADIKYGEGSFVFDDLLITLYKNVHIENPFGNLNSYGLDICENNAELNLNQIPLAYISTDTRFLTLARPNIHELIFHECFLHGSSPVHTSYEEFLKLPLSLRKNIYFYHCSPTEENEKRAQEDGFGGFVKPRQVFEFASLKEQVEKEKRTQDEFFRQQLAQQRQCGPLDNLQVPISAPAAKS